MAERLLDHVPREPEERAGMARRVGLTNRDDGSADVHVDQDRQDGHGRDVAQGLAVDGSLRPGGVRGRDQEQAGLVGGRADQQRDGKRDPLAADDERATEGDHQDRGRIDAASVAQQNDWHRRRDHEADRQPRRKARVDLKLTQQREQRPGGERRTQQGEQLPREGWGERQPVDQVRDAEPERVGKLCGPLGCAAIRV